jgi:MOSC domain-containing protein YiiM
VKQRGDTLKVARIYIRTPDKSTVSLQKALLVKDAGIQGDKNARGGDRQLSLLPLKVREDIEKGIVTGLCLPRFTENITYTGDSQLKEGERYLIGEAVIEISGTRKRCFSECENIIKNKPCILVKTVSYAKIILSGNVDENDEIQPFTGMEGDWE